MKLLKNFIVPWYNLENALSWLKNSEIIFNSEYKVKISAIGHVPEAYEEEDSETSPKYSSSRPKVEHI